MKEFKTYEEQISILKNRGLIIDDENFALEKLKEDNYYNIVNGYKDLFITPGTTDNYISGSTFEELYALYDFDRSLKSIFFKSILKVENILRSLIAYNFSEKFGNKDYLVLDNFETLRGSGCTATNYEKRIEQIQRLFSNIQNDIASAIYKKPYINHYMLNYGFVPLWVLVNSMSLGRLSNFYSLMNQSVRVKVSMNWNISDGHLDQYIKLMSYFRNLCAHDERLYNAKYYQDIPDTNYHSTLNISIINSRYQNGKNDIFALLITMKVLLSEEDFNTLCNKVNGRLMSISTKLKCISFDMILDAMGFPSNWLDIKKA